MLTTDELLRPRYKVVGPYPWSPYKIGDIITMPPDGRSFHLTTTEYTDEFGDRTKLEHWHAPEEILKYENLFQPLPWWSDREPEDMPEFVKTNPDYAKPGLTFKVKAAEKFVDGIGLLCEDGYSDKYVSARYFIPATLTEYEAYNKQKEGNRE